MDVSAAHGRAAVIVATPRGPPAALDGSRGPPYHAGAAPRGGLTGGRAAVGRGLAPGRGGRGAVGGRAPGGARPGPAGGAAGPPLSCWPRPGGRRPPVT